MSLTAHQSRIGIQLLQVVVAVAFERTGKLVDGEDSLCRLRVDETGSRERTPRPALGKGI